MEVIITCGIPTSGKSTFAKKVAEQRGFFILSRDELRIKIFGLDYKQNHKDEVWLTEIYDEMLDIYIDGKENIILDNTHCRTKYLNMAINRFKNTDYQVTVKFFEIGVYTAIYRNIVRYFKTGKWIPIHVIQSMKDNFDKINKDKYEQYGEHILY